MSPIYSDADFTSNIRDSDTLESFSQRTGICKQTVARRYGTWNNLRKKVGFEPRKPGVYTNNTDEFLFRQYIVGDTRNSFCKRVGIATKTLSNRFGRWGEFKEKALRRG